MNTKLLSKSFTITIFFLVINISSFSQVTLSQVGPPIKDFIKLKNDSIIIGSSINKEIDAFGRINIKLDGKIYDIKYIDFYGVAGKNIYSSELLFTKSCAFYGKINFFEVFSTGQNRGGYNSNKKINYYSVGLGKVKKLKTKYLVNDITGNYEAIQEIKKANKLRKAALISFGAAVLVGCTTGKLGSAGIIGSFGCVSLGAMFSIAKKDHMKKSISYYTHNTYNPYKK